jgi:hypothetical protein
MECTILEKVRRCSLWTLLGGAVLLAILLILLAWGAIDFFKPIEIPSFLDVLGDGGIGPEAMSIDPFGGIELSIWGKFILSLGTIVATASTLLLGILVGKYAKKEK